MKTSEQMTADVLKRRDEELKARRPVMIRRIATVAVPCAAALAVTAVTAASIHSVAGTHRGDYIAGREYGGTMWHGTTEIGKISGGSENFATSYNDTDLAAVTSGDDWFLKNPNAGKYVFKLTTYTGANRPSVLDLVKNEITPDYNELSDPKYTFIPYGNEGLNKYYNIEFDRFGRLHSDWIESTDRQTGVYYLEQSNATTTSIELKCDTNTLNYTTPSGAKISVTAKHGRFFPETVSSTAVERPKPEETYMYDENGNVVGAFTPGYDPGNTGTVSGNNDLIVVTIIQNGEGNEFLTYIDMGSSWVKLYANGISYDEFRELFDEYTA